MSGDARRVLELCRRAELAEGRGGAEDGAKVLMNDIKAAQDEMFQSPHMRMLEAASRHDRIFLAALLLELKRSGVTRGEHHARHAHARNPLPRERRALAPGVWRGGGHRMVLASAGLLLADPGRKRAAQRVCLNVPVRTMCGRAPRMSEGLQQKKYTRRRC